MATVQITLPDALAEMAAKAGLFDPDAVEAMVREELEAYNGLRDAIRVGDESGPGIPANEVFAELRAKIGSIISHRHTERA